MADAGGLDRGHERLQARIGAWIEAGQLHRDLVRGSVLGVHVSGLNEDLVADELHAARVEGR